MSQHRCDRALQSVKLLGESQLESNAFHRLRSFNATPNHSDVRQADVKFLALTLYFSIIQHIFSAFSNFYKFPAHKNWPKKRMNGTWESFTFLRVSRSGSALEVVQVSAQPALAGALLIKLLVINYKAICT